MEKSRILLVEDDQITLSFLSDLLENEGYEVLKAENGQSALGLLQSNAPDLIISDVLMPEVSGFDLFRKVQEEEKFQNLPFIFLTSLDDGEEMLKLKSLGPDDYLPKPVKPRHLLATVKGKLVRKQRRDKQAEKERDRMRNKIRWTLSHELRTPLTIIQGISELLLSDGPLPQASDYQDLLQNLRSQSFQLGSLIENFLLVTRIDAGVEEESYRKGAEFCGLSETVEEVAFPIWEKARAKGARFLVDVPQNLPPVFVYRPHLVDILRQVLENAFKFADPVKPKVSVRAALENGRVKVVVSDNGRGLSEREQEMVFQKLSQVDREIHEQQGSGLGLYIAKKLVDLNRGSIALRSVPGQGVEVEILLPTAPAAAA